MGMTRREVLAQSAIGALGAAVPTAGARDGEVGAPKFSSARDEMLAVIRVLGDLAGIAAPWWYTGYVYGMTPGEAPRKLWRFEGCEINLFAPQADGSFRQTGRTATFFQDPDTQAVLDHWNNPYTGARIAVRPNLLGGSGGYSLWSDAGIEPHFNMGASAASGTQPGPQALHVSWTVHGSHVWMRHDRVYPPGLPQPLAESSTMLIERRDLLDRRRNSAPALFSSTYMAPWPTWAGMADRAGHVIWHADGVKLRSVDDLPRAYLDRVRRLFPQQLVIS